jgi:hypothetical protein
MIVGSLMFLLGAICEWLILSIRHVRQDVVRCENCHWFKGEIPSDLREVNASTAGEYFRKNYRNEPSQDVADRKAQETGPLPVRGWTSRISTEDMLILSKVASDYGLQGDACKLLYAIYIAENGVPGREMGVLNPEAMRFKGDHDKSLTLQAQWAAGTIAKRFDGNLEAFAQRWCPLNAGNDPTGLNANWLPNVQKIMAEMNG